MFQNENNDSSNLDFWFPGKDSNDSLDEWKPPLNLTNNHGNFSSFSVAYPKPLKAADWISGLDARIIKSGPTEQKEEWTLQSENVFPKINKGPKIISHKNKKSQMDFEKNPLSAKKQNANRFQNHYKGPSVLIDGEWKLREEMEFPSLQKVQVSNLKDHKILYTTTCNSRIIDNYYEKVNLKRGQCLISEDTQGKTSCSLINDEFVRNYIASHEERCIFLTDNAASLIMSATRTIFPWDLDITVANDGNFFVESREDDASYPPVNENINFMTVQNSRDLSVEVNNFLETFIKTLPLLEESSNFKDNETIYKYLEWDLIDNLKLVVRCRQHASTKMKSNILSVLFHVFIDSHNRWGNSLESSRGSILAIELRNNASSISRTIYNAILGNMSQIGLMFINRETPTDSKKHSILGCQFLSPLDLAEQVNLNILNGFGILKDILETVMLHASNNSDDDKQKGKSFSLLREPNKPLLLLYEK